MRTAPAAAAAAAATTSSRRMSPRRTSPTSPHAHALTPLTQRIPSQRMPTTLRRHRSFPSVVFSFPLTVLIWPCKDSPLRYMGRKEDCRTVDRQAVGLVGEWAGCSTILPFGLSPRLVVHEPRTRTYARTYALHTPHTRHGNWRWRDLVRTFSILLRTIQSGNEKRWRRWASMRMRLYFGPCPHRGHGNGIGTHARSVRFDSAVQI